MRAFRDIFRQGLIEQVLFMAALESFAIPVESVAGCIRLTTDGPDHRFKTGPAMFGASLGGMYTVMLRAIGPRFGAVATVSSAGGWSQLLTMTKLFTDDAAAMLALATPVDFMHPAISIAQLALEPVDPMAYMAQLRASGLPENARASTLQIAVNDDGVVPRALYDATALAFRHPQAGVALWSSMQQSLELAGLGGLREYPIKSNLVVKTPKPTGGPSEEWTTGAVVQYEGDGIYDPFAIDAQRSEVVRQVGCFLSSVLLRKETTILAPAHDGTYPLF